MGMHDRGHIGPMAIHPQMEAVRRIHHAVALEYIKIVVNQHDIGLVEAESEAEHPVCAWPIAARGDLTGERGLVALGGENPTGQRYLLAQRPGRHLGGMLALAGIAAMF